MTDPQYCHRMTLMARTMLLGMVLTALLAWSLASASIPQTPQRQQQFSRLWMGVAWYPEQWPQSRWNKDLDLMKAAGVSVVRVGEFAWSREEPSEGHYDFKWLETAIKLAAQHGIKVVLGTPTDAPPAWLTSKYPQVLRVDAQGQRLGHGGRRQFSNASPLYLKFCRLIATRLAEEFGHNPDVVGWQIDNEYTDTSYDAGTRHQFQDWLQRKYGMLAALNKVWATAYWSQTYTTWDQIPMNGKPGNPGLMLDHERFVTYTWVRFQQVQLDALRAHIAPWQFVTTNLGGLGWADRFDRYAISKPLDLISWDDYVGMDHLKPDLNGATNDLVRGWKRQDFWVMETQPGSVDWAPINTMLYKGETRALAWEDVGHGADAVLYWQWRSALNGQEQYHGALVGPDGEPLPIYTEISQLGREFKKASLALRGTTPESSVAILQTYPSRWAIDFQPFSKKYDQIAVLLDYYRPLERRVHAVDIVSAWAPLDRYHVVYAPSLNVIGPRLARHLTAYVRQGGHLVLGPRSGMKDPFNRLNRQRQPGPLAEVLGGRVAQYYALFDPTPVAGTLGEGQGTIWAEQLQPEAHDVHVLLRYGPGYQWFSGTPAVIQRQYGKGEITYLGTILDPALMRSFVDLTLKHAHVTSAFPYPVPEHVEVMRRVGQGHSVFIFVNHAMQPATVDLHQFMTNVLTGEPPVRQIHLAAQGVAVMQYDRMSIQEPSR